MLFHSLVLISSLCSFVFNLNSLILDLLSFVFCLLSWLLVLGSILLLLSLNQFLTNMICLALIIFKICIQIIWEEKNA